MRYYERLRLFPPAYELENAVSGRISNGCWFVAACGVAVFQGALLAQAWDQDQSALRTASIAGAWLLGLVVGQHVRYALRRATFPALPLLAGVAYLCCALGWWLALTPALAARPAGDPLGLALVLVVVAFLMGVTSTCWLGQRRPWPAIGEPATVSRGLICLTLGLCIAWTWPAWVGWIGLLLVIPLIALDLYPAARSPLLAHGGLVDALIDRDGGDPATWLPLQLERRGGSRWWWVSYFVRRRYLPPILLSTGLSVMTGAIWYSVPTPFAAHLVRVHQVGTLSWLVAGQLAALALGGYLFGKSRGTVGAPDRLIPQECQQRGWRLARLALFLMAGSLVLLGLPFLQAPWWLALSLACYTLAGGIWHILLARLRPTISTQAYSLRHLLVGAGQAISSGQLSYERALEDRATLILATWEGALVAVAAPLAGLLIDRTTFDDTLVLVGLALFLFFALALLTLRLFQRAPQGGGRAEEGARALLSSAGPEQLQHVCEVRGQEALLATPLQANRHARLPVGREETETRSRVRARGSSLRIIAACLVALALAVHFTDYGPLIPVMLKTLHIVPGQAGLMSTLLFVGLTLTCLPGGILADRYGQRPVLLGSTLLMTLGGLLLPLWPNIFWMLACRALIGLGAGAAFVAGAGVVAGGVKHTPLAQGLYGGCVQIGAGLGLLATPLLAARLGWQGTFLFWGALSIPALLLWLFANDGWQALGGHRVNVWAGLRSPAVWTLGLAHLGTFGIGSVIAAWITVYLVHQYGISLGLAATFGALGPISGALFRPLGGYLLGRKVMGAVALLRTGTMLTFLGVASLALPLRQPALAILGMTLVAIGSTLPYTAVFASAAKLQTVSKGVAQGLLSMIAWQIVLWGPPLVGFLFQVTGNFSLPLSSILLFSAVAITASILANLTVAHDAVSEERGQVYASAG
jgi:nitrate/nitrite transporter NarK